MLNIVFSKSYRYYLNNYINKYGANLMLFNLTLNVRSTPVLPAGQRLFKHLAER